MAEEDRRAPDSEADAGLLQRVEALERVVASLRDQITTNRLSVVDVQGRERLLVSEVGPVVELRLPLVGAAQGRMTEILLFSVEGQDGLPGGVGLQLWADGSLVRELTVWEDELPSAAD